MLKLGMGHHLLQSLALPFILASYLEGECIMKLSCMRKNEMLDFYLLLDIQQPLLLQQLMLCAQWRCQFLQFTISVIHIVFFGGLPFKDASCITRTIFFFHVQSICSLLNFVCVCGFSFIYLSIYFLLQWYWLMALKSLIGYDETNSIRIWRWKSYLIQVYN